MGPQEIIVALAAEGLSPVAVNDGSVYVYIDGPQPGPVAVEWLLTFRFEDCKLSRFAIEKHLVGP